jgi:hypothetical protein
MAGVIMIVVLAIVLLFILFVGWALHSRWAAERGWVYNKHNPRPRGGGTLGLLEAIYQPSIEHVIEERASQRARPSRDDSGDPPEAGRRHRS